METKTLSPQELMHDLTVLFNGSGTEDIEHNNIYKEILSRLSMMNKDEAIQLIIGEGRNEMKQKFWEVEIRNNKFEGERTIYYVFAKTAGEAEREGIHLASHDKDWKDGGKWYCVSVTRVGYILS